jgi:uncharacterized membrane protein HdeD (DUF308 family)
LKNHERLFCASFWLERRRSLGLYSPNTGAAFGFLLNPKICCKLSIPDYFNRLLGGKYMPMGIIMPGMDEVRRHWGWVLALGILLFVLGLVATSAAFTTTLLTVLTISVLLIIAGLLELFNGSRNAHFGGFWMHLFTGILDLVCGGLLMAYPAVGALTLTLILAIFFLVGGGVRAISALMINLPNGGWAVLSGILDIVLGVFLLCSWPFSGLWFLGLAVGISLIFRGFWWAAFALAVRKTPKV